MHADSRGCGSACRQQKMQELLCGLGSRQATEGARVCAWWTCAVGVSLNGLGAVSVIEKASHPNHEKLV
jgi:hypothetical protein